MPKVRIKKIESKYFKSILDFDTFYLFSQNHPSDTNQGACWCVCVCVCPPTPMCVCKVYSYLMTSFVGFNQACKLKGRKQCNEYATRRGKLNTTDCQAQPPTILSWHPFPPVWWWWIAGGVERVCETRAHSHRVPRPWPRQKRNVWLLAHIHFTHTHNHKRTCHRLVGAFDRFWRVGWGRVKWD